MILQSPSKLRLYELEKDTANESIINNSYRDSSIHGWTEGSWLKASVQRSDITSDSKNDTHTQENHFHMQEKGK